MAWEDARLDWLRDHRKLLLDRIPVAVELLGDSSVVFPARRHFLLDWLLDGIYRLFKASSSRYDHHELRAYLQDIRGAVKGRFLASLGCTDW